MWCTSAQPASARRLETRWRFHLSRCPDFGVHFFSHARGRALRAGRPGPRAPAAGTRGRLHGPSGALRERTAATGRSADGRLDQSARQEIGASGCPRNDDRPHGQPTGRPDSRPRRRCRARDDRSERDSNYSTLGVSMSLTASAPAYRMSSSQRPTIASSWSSCGARMPPITSATR